MPLIFGHPSQEVQYTARRAAYVVIINEDARVAMVRDGLKMFLPGGGSEPDEAPEETVRREVLEESGRGLQLTRFIGEAIQYFYSQADERHYMMRAAFFRGEFTNEPQRETFEHELEWLSVDEAVNACFHACHAWAIRQA